MKFKVNVQGEEKELEVVRQGDQLRITHDGQTTAVTVVHRDGGHFVLSYELPATAGEIPVRKSVRAAGLIDGDRRQLWVNGKLLNYSRVRKAMVAPDEEAASLSATIPAVVSKILVAVGDKVVAGDKLILLESMKMIFPIAAPYDGVVMGLHCEVGEAVAPGNPLLQLDKTPIKEEV